MLIPSWVSASNLRGSSLSRRVNANSQRLYGLKLLLAKLIKKGEC